MHPCDNLKTGMKNIVGATAFIFFAFAGSAQQAVFQKYDFNEEGYAILGLLSESDRNTLRDSLLLFYTDDPAILNEIRASWVFDQKGPFYACGYHYIVSVCKDGTILDSFAINLNCNTIVTSDGSFYFDVNKLRRFYGRVKTPVVRREKYESAAFAKKAIDSLKKESTLLMLHEPVWVTYEGEFTFVYPCSEEYPDCYDSEEQVLEQLTRQFASQFHNEPFELTGVGGSRTELYVKVKSNRSFLEKMDPSTNYVGDWKSYDRTLTTYWKR